VRSMSFSLTERQFLDGSKTVTRRLGWASLGPGARLRAVRKAMGLKKGEQQVVLGTLLVTGVTREELGVISQADVVREGFPEMTPEEFVAMFCKHMGGKPNQIVTRIEFEKVTG
jgi:hypothetical protein